MARARRFSFAEILMSCAIVVASAGVLVPALSMRDLDRVREHVDSDLAALGGAVRRYVDDTRTFPTGAGGATTFHFLFTDGVRPRNNLLASGPGIHVSEFLADGGLGGENWHGPYLEAPIGPDPWGNAYLVNVNGFFSSEERTIVLSAGPNGQLNTAPSATTAGGDDLMLLIE